jgi:hypothetical protein
MELLCRLDSDPEELCIDVHEMKDGTDLQATIKTAARVWITTEEGAKQYYNANENFNWGDATYMPAEFTNTYGFRYMMPIDLEQTAVDHNEYLMA